VDARVRRTALALGLFLTPLAGWAAAADVQVPFSVSYLVAGLTLGTPVWIDLAAKSVTTASAMGLSNVGVIAIEF